PSLAGNRARDDPEHRARGGLLVARRLLSAATLWATCGCLPADDRPPPGSVTFTVSPSPAVRDGIVTDDGWSMAFTRLVVGIGRTGLSDGCTEYAEARYDRLLDVTKGSG